MKKRKRLFLLLGALGVLLLVLGFMKWRELQEGRFPRISKEDYETLKACYQYDPTVPVDGHIVETTEMENSTRYKVIYRSSTKYLPVAYLEIPNDAPNPCPVVALLHIFRRSKESWYEEGDRQRSSAVRKALVDAGFAVFAMDNFLHGERKESPAYLTLETEGEDDGRSAGEKFGFRETAIQTIIDCRRGLDYLESREDIDCSRVGAYGNCAGGNLVLSLTAFEPRVKVTVSGVPPADMADPDLLPSNYRWGIGDRYLLMQMGTRDNMCTKAQAKDLYSLLKGKNSKLVFYDAGHRLPDESVDDAVAWFKEHL